MFINQKKKIITNKDKVPPKLRNYVAKRKTWVDKDNGGEAATHFTISEETAEMKLPTDGWDYIGRDKITMDDADVPEDKESGAILNGSEGSYTWA